MQAPERVPSLHRPSHYRNQLTGRRDSENPPACISRRTHSSPMTACIEWTGYCRPTNGYGQTGRNFAVHRMAWAMAHGCPIPRGMHVCHTCDNPPCYNPDHLFLGTPQDNASDRKAKGRGRSRSHNADKMYCVRGHRYDAANARMRPTGGRACRSCDRDDARRRRGLV